MPLYQQISPLALAHVKLTWQNRAPILFNYFRVRADINDAACNPNTLSK
jgi:hypothetical protein